jgi:hypothetical protein
MLRQTFVWLVALGLAACSGGGGSEGAAPFGGGTGGGPAPGEVVASNLTLSLSGSSVTNTGSATISATATTTSSGGQVVPSTPVTFSVDNKASFTVPGTSTGVSGTLVATVGIGSDKSNRIITVSAVSGSLTATASFVVTGAKLTGTAVPSIVTPGSANNRVDFRLVDGNDSPIASQAISIQAGSLGTSTGTTNASGVYAYTYTAPAAVGVLDVVATAGGVSNTQTIQIQSGSGSSVPDVTTPILSASVAANPSVVSTNTPTTNNRTEIRALFVGADNAPIKNVRVRFDLAGDASSVGGAFSTGDNIIYSDANGIATTAYVPGSRSSPTNGVTVRACYGPSDFASCAAAPSSVTTTITVASDPLAVTIGSNEVVYLGTSDLTYQRRFVVQVVDASGAAKANVQIVPSVDIDRYYKGQYFNAGGWRTGFTTSVNGTTTFFPAPPFECFNEDINRNGVLEAGEDLNHSATLEPRKSDVAVSVIGSTATNTSGIAVVQIEYPRNVGTWARVRILVSATGVSGTEGRATWTEILPVPTTALTGVGAPAFVTSPYGIEIFSRDGVVFPDDTSIPKILHDGVTPCNNPN